MDRAYSELIHIPSFEERYDYLRLGATVGADTFGHERYLNQEFYRSPEWRRARRDAIARDEACDLAWPDYPIKGRLIVHHINPLTADEVADGGYSLFDMENLITVSHRTHNAIHYGSRELLPKPLVERRPGDTKLW